MLEVEQSEYEVVSGGNVEELEPPPSTVHNFGSRDTAKAKKMEDKWICNIYL